VVGTSSALDLVALSPTRWVGQGATLAIPLTVEALDLGVPKANVAVNFTVTKGTASLSAGSATTSGSGFASISASLKNQNADVQVSACVAPNNSPCQTFTLFSTPSSLWTLETVSGSPQIVPAGQSFELLAMRVTDGSNAANPVMGVNVTFAITLARVGPGQGPGPGPNSGGRRDGDATAGGNAMPVLLGSSEAQVVSAQDGAASIVPSVGNVGPCDVFITVSAGHATTQLQMESVAAIVPAPPKKSPPPRNPTAQPDLYFIPFGSPDTGSPASAPPTLPEILLAVPDIAQPDEPAASQSTCSAAPPDAASRTDESSGETVSTATGDVASRPCEPPSEAPHSDVDVPRSPPEPPAESRTTLDRERQ
jgi:hypothetical protein